MALLLTGVGEIQHFMIQPGFLFPFAVRKKNHHFRRVRMSRRLQQLSSPMLAPLSESTATPCQPADLEKEFSRINVFIEMSFKRRSGGGILGNVYISVRRVLSFQIHPNSFPSKEPVDLIVVLKEKGKGRSCGCSYNRFLFKIPLSTLSTGVTIISYS